MLLANFALPFWFLVTPFMVLITPVIIGVEAIVIFAYLIKDSFLNSLKISSIANITSSLSGIFYIVFADALWWRWWRVLAPQSSYEAKNVFIEISLEKYRALAVILLYLISVFIEYFFLVERSSIGKISGNKTMLRKGLICSFMMNAISYLICVPLFYRVIL